MFKIQIPAPSSHSWIFVGRRYQSLFWKKFSGIYIKFETSISKNKISNNKKYDYCNKKLLRSIKNIELLLVRFKEKKIGLLQGLWLWSLGKVGVLVTLITVKIRHKGYAFSYPSQYLMPLERWSCWYQMA